MRGGDGRAESEARATGIGEGTGEWDEARDECRGDVPEPPRRRPPPTCAGKASSERPPRAPRACAPGERLAPRRHRAPRDARSNNTRERGELRGGRETRRGGRECLGLPTRAARPCSSPSRPKLARPRARSTHARRTLARGREGEPGAVGGRASSAKFGCCVFAARSFLGVLTGPLCLPPCHDREVRGVIDRPGFDFIAALARLGLGLRDIRSRRGDARGARMCSTSTFALRPARVSRRFVARLTGLARPSPRPPDPPSSPWRRSRCCGRPRSSARARPRACPRGVSRGVPARVATPTDGSRSVRVARASARALAPRGGAMVRAASSPRGRHHPRRHSRRVRRRRRRRRPRAAPRRGPPALVACALAASIVLAPWTPLAATSTSRTAGAPVAWAKTLGAGVAEPHGRRRGAGVYTLETLSRGASPPPSSASPRFAFASSRKG